MLPQDLTSATSAGTGCCPRFDPSTVTDQQLVWKDRLFLREHVHSLLFMPIDVKHKVRSAFAKIEAAHARKEGGLMLGKDQTAWSSELLIEVSKEVPDAEMVHLSGSFLAKAFEGSYKNMPRWIEQMESFVASRGKNIVRLFYGYTTCPKCSQAYGENYVVLYAQVEP